MDLSGLDITSAGTYRAKSSAVSNATQTTMSQVPYDPDQPMTNAHSFCPVSGNPPVWGCSRCDWRFAITECDLSSEVPSREQARIAHTKHSCPADPDHKPTPL
jgi:hypothetical protein